MEAVALALVPPDDSDFVFVSPINEHCPIGGAAGGGGGKGGVFATGKTGSFGTTGPLTDTEKAAVTSYKSVWYNEINSTLRGSGHGQQNAPHEVIASKIEGMHAAVAKGVTKEAAVVYRGVNHPAVNKIDWQSKVGTKVTFKGFTSTSQSEKFAKLGKGWVGPTGTVFRVYVPKGATALETSKTRSSLGHEREVILPHNSTFTVHAATKRPSGGHDVDLIMHR
jgi:hypothetical protein